MDQDSTSGSDKRSWRERLGIGASKEMPRIADEFKPGTKASNGSGIARPAVRPAPMAPRRNPGGNAVPGGGAPEQLAAKLKIQREASEKLAEQRILVAKQRAEIKPAVPSTTLPPSTPPKPKFTFAEEEPPPNPVAAAPATTAATVSARAPSAAPVGTAAAAAGNKPAAKQAPATPAAAPAGTPAAKPPGSPQLQPPRPGLGAERPALPPRQATPQAYPPQTSYAKPSQSFSNKFPPQVPAYRPREAQGYMPPPSYQPQPRGYPPSPAGYPGTPRLNMPTRGVVPGYGGQDYGAAYGETDLRHPRQLRPPGRGYGEAGEADIFEEPRLGRRATPGDYQQAYREAEVGYDDEMPRSRGPWVLLLLLLLAAAVAGIGVWFYLQNVKPLISGNGETPVVSSPGTPDKTASEAVTDSQPAAGQPSRKQIYDRIVGDREVLGGEVIQTEEPPVEPVNQQGTGDQGQGEEATPLPLPPPPGDSGDQGALSDPGSNKTAMIAPAAGESQAADSSSGDAPIVPPVVAPVPGEQSGAGLGDGAEIISDPAEPAAPEVASNAAAELPVKKPKKPAAKKVEQNLGSEPVVLVPESQDAVAGVPDTGGAVVDGTSDGGGLYGGEGVVDAQTPATPPAVTTATPKKKKTIADLFRGEENTATTEQSAGIADPPPPTTTQQKAVTQPAQQQVASTGNYVIQLASFKSKAEATQEYSRLRTKHPSILSGLSPIVTEAVVGGSTRYRLSAGAMASSDQAKVICAKLISAGERDCLVRKQ